MSGHPVHRAILRAGVHAANAILLSGCINPLARYFSGPRTPMRLPICSPGPAIADLITNEVAQIINRKNNSLKEGVRSGGLKQNAKSN
jgi:hypothetical protein